MRSPTILVYTSITCMAIALTTSTTANMICQYLKIQANVNDRTYSIYTVGIFWGGRNDLTGASFENDDTISIQTNNQCYSYDHVDFDTPWIVARVFAVLSIVFGITTLILACVFTCGMSSSSMYYSSSSSGSLELETVMVTRYVGLLGIFCAVLQGLTLFLYASDEACPAFDDVREGSFVMEVPLSCVGDVGVGLTVGSVGMWVVGSMCLGCALRRMEDGYYY